MSKKHNQYSNEQKVLAVREHLLDLVPISDVCVKHEISPALYDEWQKTLFENGTVAFEYKQSISDDDYDFIEDNNEVKSIFMLAQKYFESGDLTTAEQKYRIILEKYPDIAETHYRLGEIFYKQNRFLWAKSAFRSALKLNPTHSKSIEKLDSYFSEKNESSKYYQKDSTKDFSLFRYLKNDGTFDYDKYKMIQQKGNFSKINNTWVIESNIEFLSKYLSSSISSISFGICHGTRNGSEQKWFRKYLCCEVVGTEISESASQFPDTIKWDFHQVKPEWIGKADFIYSNSFDHSYAPDTCLNTWIDSMRVGGLCIIEHSNLHEPEGTNELDPFGAKIEIMPYLVTKWGKGKFVVKEILDAPQKNPSIKTLQFIIIERRK